MHYAVHGNTAAEVIFNRVDSKKENIGLTNFKGNMPTRAETETHKDILEGAGTISHEKALEKAHKEYDKYMRNHLTQAEKDYLEIMGEDTKKLK